MRAFLENTKNNGFASFVICFLVSTILLCILAFYSPFPYTVSRIQHVISHNNQDDANCDLFKGKWIEDPKGPLYTNVSCPTIPTSKDCFLHGRDDKDFLYWRWKPDECELPRFEHETFFKQVRNKRLAFIGDSVARNQMESLLCLLSQEETPTDVFKDAKDRSRTWFFPRNNVTLMVLWTRFLIKGIEKEGGVSDLHLDQLDENWSHIVTRGLVDYAIVSNSQWFFKKNYLYEEGKLIGCVYCDDQKNVTEFPVGFAIGKAFQTTLRFLQTSKEVVTVVRTISPSHFENGTWKTGGSCERRKHYNKEEAAELLVRGKNNLEWEVRNIQMNETEAATLRATGMRKRDKRLQAMDITSVMLMRPDGHPGLHWRDKKKKGFNDCVHWCMPGPIDVWNDLLLALLKRSVIS